MDFNYLVNKWKTYSAAGYGMGICSPVKGFQDLPEILLRYTNSVILKYYPDPLFGVLKFNINGMIGRVFAGILASTPIPVPLADKDLKN